MLEGSINLGSPVNWGSPLNQGLVSWWLPLPNNSGGGTLFDLCGPNHGTLTNMDPATDWVPGPKSLAALDFDGTDDYIALPSRNLNLSSASVFAWINTANAGSGRTRIVGHQGGTYFLLALSSNVLEVGWSTDSVLHTKGSAINDSNWHHVGFTRVPGSTITYYLDGVSIGTQGTAAGAAITATTGAIGRRPDFSSEYIAAKISDIRIHNRALTVTEVAQLYQDSLTGYRQTLNRGVRIFPVSLPAGGGTFTATAAVTVSTATCSGSASHDPPTYTASAAVAVTGATASGAASHTPPTFRGDSSSHNVCGDGNRLCGAHSAELRRNCRGECVDRDGQRQRITHSADIRGDGRSDGVRSELLWFRIVCGSGIVRSDGCGDSIERDGKRVCGVYCAGVYGERRRHDERGHCSRCGDVRRFCRGRSGHGNGRDRERHGGIHRGSRCAVNSRFAAQQQAVTAAAQFTESVSARSSVSELVRCV